MPEHPRQPGVPPPPGSAPGGPVLPGAPSPGPAQEWLPADPTAAWPHATNGCDPVTAQRQVRRGWYLLVVFVLAEITFLLTSVLVVVPFVLGAPAPVPGATGDRPLPPGALVAALVVPTVLAALVATAGVGLVGRGTVWERLRTDLSIRWRLPDIGVGLALGTVGVIISLPASALWARWVGQDHANSAVGEVFDGQRLPFGIAVTVFLGVWLVAPLCEEVLYRGVLWRAMECWGWNRWVIFTLTSLAFAFAHWELLRTPLLVIISLPIALARMLTGNVLAGVVAHQTNNFLPAVGLLLVTLGLMPG